LKKIITSSYYLFLSITAVISSVLMILIKPNIINTNIFTEKLLVIGAFFTSCILGISLAIYPNWWKKNKIHTNYNQNFKYPEKKRSFKGHHPDCNKFKNHIIFIKNKPRCTGCLGLIMGAITSILLIILYLIIPLKLSINTYYILFIIGIIILFLVYGELLFLKRNRFVHILLNSLLIIGFLIITLSILEITNNSIYAIITLILCFLWLNTRIIISNQQHHRICDSCIKECKSF
jgi:hypothetical protein